jgi:hypothetical protein
LCFAWLRRKLASAHSPPLRRTPGEGQPSVPSAGPDRHRSAPLPRGCCVRRLATRRDNASNDKSSIG